MVVVPQLSKIAPPAGLLPDLPTVAGHFGGNFSFPIKLIGKETYYHLPILIMCN